MPIDVPQGPAFSHLSWMEQSEPYDQLLRIGWIVLEDVSREQDLIEKLLGRLGELQPQYGGIRFWDVVPRKPGEHTSIGDQKIDLHTELAEYPQPPDYVALYCVKQAKRGGALHLLDVQPLLESLTPTEVSDLLETEMTIMCEPSIAEEYGDISISAPILSRVRDHLSVRFDSTFIDSGSPKCVRDFRDRVMALAAEHTVRFVQSGGALVIWDNLRVLHGRSRFNDPDRHLWRCCVAAKRGQP